MWFYLPLCILDFHKPDTRTVTKGKDKYQAKCKRCGKLIRRKAAKHWVQIQSN